MRYNRKGFNDYKIIGDYVEIYIHDCIVLIDKEDLEKVKTRRWFISGKKVRYPYADFYKNNIRNRVRLHNFLIGKQKDLVVDHINLNKFDNRKENLRFVTYRINGLNKGGKGYSISKSKKDRNLKRVIVQMVLPNGKNLLKRFLTIKEALKYRNTLELKYLGFIIKR